MPKKTKKLLIETVISNKVGVHEKFECMINCDEDVDEHGMWLQMQRKFMEVIGVDVHKSNKKKSRKQKFRAEKIMSFSIKSSTFIVKCANKDEIEFVHMDEAKKKFPKLVIEYFQERLKWFPIKV